MEYDNRYNGESSWIGKKLKIQNNGDHILFNKDDEEILLKTHAPKGASWIAYNSESTGIQAHATVTDILEEEIIGIKDSVKIISLQISDPENEVIEESYLIAISKTHGLVRCPQLCLFPFFSSTELTSIFYENQTTLELVGSSSPKRGVDNLTWEAVHDFSPGDEIHRTREHLAMLLPYENEYYSRVSDRKVILICLSRTTNEKEETVYRFQREFEERKINDPSYGSNSYSLGCDTMTLTYGKNPIFDILPGEILVDENKGVHSWYMFLENGRACKKSIFNGHIEEYENQYITPIIDGGYSECFYRGLGMLSSTDGFFGYGREAFNYYKKGDIIWGAPLTLTSIESVPEETCKIIIENNQIGVVSSPFAFPAFIEVYTIGGTLLTKGYLYSSEERLKINSIPNAILIIHCTPYSGNKSSVKILP